MLDINARHRIAYFVSPHGFGHAARASAVMAALHEIDPAFHFDIFTRVPRWFFDDSLRGAFTYHPLLTDIGLVQETALREDLAATVAALNRFLPFRPTLVRDCAAQVARLKCELVVCDIAPLGIAVARAAGIPSVLVENFTWDWIYRGYARDEPRLRGAIAYLRGAFRSVDYYIQTEPVCRYGAADLTTAPISRTPRLSRMATREKLEILRAAKAVLITMGGIPGKYDFLRRLNEQRGVHFVIPGNGGSARRESNLVLLPHHSEFYHPDLVNACDAVIGKLGYSTVAEVYHAGIPLGYVSRARFRESPVMARFVRRRMNGVAISEAQFLTGDWLRHLPDLLALLRLHRREQNGAAQAARFIAKLLA
ncbi:MAG TPA: glycosyltransferase family protein [Anaerolineae bacterium]